jgi:putative molybdopterin biosynthesis protein
MSRIVIKPAWILNSKAGDHFEQHLFRLLRAIHETGKLTRAVEVVGLSYRHGWDLLAKWTRIFGSELVAMERGKGARLTALGEKLLWAEQRSEASLFPQLENIATELNVAIRDARQRNTTVIRIHASHGYAVEKLPELARQDGHAEIDLKYVGSVEALAALSRSACELAGFHVPLGELGPMLWEEYAKWIKLRRQRIIKMVIRTQGLIVAKDNPRKITSLRDLMRKGVKFVNRQRGRGRASCSMGCCAMPQSIRHESAGMTAANSLTPPWRPLSQAAWPTSGWESNPRHDSSSWTSTQWPRSDTCLLAEPKPCHNRP